jgi:hypothetical protein
MIQININGRAHYLPEGWHEVKLTDFLNVMGNDEWLFLMTGIDLETLVRFMDVPDQLRVYNAVKALATFPDVVNLEVDFGPLPFETYVKASFAAQAKDHVKLVQAVYPECTGMVEDSFAKYWAVLKAWNQYQEKVRWIDEVPFYGKKPSTKALNKYGVYNMVYDLANGDVLKEDQVLALPTEHVFNHWALRTEKASILHNHSAPKPR